MRRACACGRASEDTIRADEQNRTEEPGPTLLGQRVAGGNAIKNGGHSAGGAARMGRAWVGGWEGPRLCPAWTLCGRPIRVCVSEVAVAVPARPDVVLSPRGNSPAGGRRTDGTGRMEVPWGARKRYLGTSPMECLLLVSYFRYLQYSSQMPRQQLGGGTGQCTCSVAHCCAAPPPHLLPPPPHTPPRLRL